MPLPNFFAFNQHNPLEPQEKPFAVCVWDKNLNPYSHKEQSPHFLNELSSNFTEESLFKKFSAFSQLNPLELQEKTFADCVWDGNLKP
jgi:hypothetical protein